MMNRPISKIFFYVVILLWIIECKENRHNYLTGSETTRSEGEHYYSINIQDTSAFYRINVGGTLDEWNTTRFFETYGGYYANSPKFQPNKYLVLENTGKTDIVNPKIVINGRRNYFDAKSILSQIINQDMSDGDKAAAIFKFLSSYEIQGHDNNLRAGPPYPEPLAPYYVSTFKERANPVKAVNCYYLGGCSLVSSNLVILCRLAGIPARAVWLCAPENPKPQAMLEETTFSTYAHHCVTEVWYDNSWHLFDVDQRIFYRSKDNLNIASYKELHFDTALISRAKVHGFASESKGNYYLPYYKKFYPPKEMPLEKWVSEMDLTLRPGEKIIWKWENNGKFHHGYNPRKTNGKVPVNLGNAQITYKPRLSLEFKNKNLEGQYYTVTGEGEGAKIHPSVTGVKSQAIFNMDAPYPVVGAKFTAKAYQTSGEGQIRFYWSALDSKWQEVPVSLRNGEQIISISLDSLINPTPKPAIYRLSFKIEMLSTEEPDGVWLSNLCFETALHTNLNALPSLSVGENKVQFKCESLGEVEITHCWEESSETEPPLASEESLFPKDRQSIGLKKLKYLEWSASVDPDGSGIEGYHIQVSYNNDMLLPVSTNFDLYIQSPETQWEVSDNWLLNNKTYYWRVRTKDNWGAWSTWSNVWQFKIK